MAARSNGRTHGVGRSGSTSLQSSGLRKRNGCVSVEKARVATPGHVIRGAKADLTTDKLGEARVQRAALFGSTLVGDARPADTRHKGGLRGSALRPGPGPRGALAARISAHSTPDPDEASDAVGLRVPGEPQREARLLEHDRMIERGQEMNVVASRVPVAHSSTQDASGNTPMTLPRRGLPYSGDMTESKGQTPSGGAPWRLDGAAHPMVRFDLRGLPDWHRHDSVSSSASQTALSPWDTTQQAAASRTSKRAQTAPTGATRSGRGAGGRAISLGADMPTAASRGDCGPAASGIAHRASTVVTPSARQKPRESLPASSTQLQCQRGSTRCTLSAGTSRARSQDAKRHEQHSSLASHQFAPGDGAVGLHAGPASLVVGRHPLAMRSPVAVSRPLQNSGRLRERQLVGASTLHGDSSLKGGSGLASQKGKRDSEAGDSPIDGDVRSPMSQQPATENGVHSASPHAMPRSMLLRGGRHHGLAVGTPHFEFGSQRSPIVPRPALGHPFLGDAGTQIAQAPRRRSEKAVADIRRQDAPPRRLATVDLRADRPGSGKEGSVSPSEASTRRARYDARAAHADVGATFPTVTRMPSMPQRSFTTNPYTRNCRPDAAAAAPHQLDEQPSLVQAESRTDEEERAGEPATERESWRVSVSGDFAPSVPFAVRRAKAKQSTQVNGRRRSGRAREVVHRTRDCDGDFVSSGSTGSLPPALLSTTGVGAARTGDTHAPTTRPAAEKEDTTLDYSSYAPAFPMRKLPPPPSMRGYETLSAYNDVLEASTGWSVDGESHSGNVEAPPDGVQVGSSRSLTKQAPELQPPTDAYTFVPTAHAAGSPDGSWVPSLSWKPPESEQTMKKYVGVLGRQLETMYSAATKSADRSARRVGRQSRRGEHYRRKLSSQSHYTTDSMAVATVSSSFTDDRAAAAGTPEPIPIMKPVTPARPLATPPRRRSVDATMSRASWDASVADRGSSVASPSPSLEGFFDAMDRISILKEGRADGETRANELRSKGGTSSTSRVRGIELAHRARGRSGETGLALVLQPARTPRGYAGDVRVSDSPRSAAAVGTARSDGSALSAVPGSGDFNSGDPGKSPSSVELFGAFGSQVPSESFAQWRKDRRPQDVGGGLDHSAAGPAASLNRRDIVPHSPLTQLAGAQFPTRLVDGASLATVAAGGNPQGPRLGIKGELILSTDHMSAGSASHRSTAANGPGAVSPSSSSTAVGSEAPYSGRKGSEWSDAESGQDQTQGGTHLRSVAGIGSLAGIDATSTDPSGSTAPGTGRRGTGHVSPWDPPKQQ